MRRFALAVLASLAIFVAPIAHAEDRIVVFAAASLKTALDAVATKYHAGGGRETFLPVRELARPTKATPKNYRSTFVVRGAML